MSEFEEVIQARNKKKEDAERAVRRRERELDDLKWLLQDARGRRILWRLFKLCNLFHGIFRGEALQDAWENGRKYPGEVLRDDVVKAVGYSIFDVMMQEDNTLKKFEEKGGD